MGECEIISMLARRFINKQLTLNIMWIIKEHISRGSITPIVQK
jgi:hypothetical protein